MHSLHLFLPCAAGVEDFLADEVHHLTGLSGTDLLTLRGGVQLHTSWHEALRLNLHSRLAQRVLLQLAQTNYRHEGDLYALAADVAWEAWFTPQHSLKVEVTAQHSPLKSLNFAALRIKDAVADRFRAKAGRRPDVDTQRPDVRIHLHLTHEQATLYIDTSGEPLFKRGWREDKGDAPLKETLAAALIMATGWHHHLHTATPPPPLYDPCCGSGTIAIEAAQMACCIPPGMRRRFAFERLLPYQAHVWQGIKEQAQSRIQRAAVPIFGSDVAHRMVDFAQRNAERAGVAHCVQWRGGDALQRLPPSSSPGLLLLNPPYGERITTAGVAGQKTARQHTSTDDGGGFFAQLASHWKRYYAGWQAWILTPDTTLNRQMRLKPSRRIPLWNGPIECRLLRFDLIEGSARREKLPKVSSTQ